MTIDKPERDTQDRVVDLFQDELNYTYLGNRQHRDDNSNIEEGLLTAYLSRRDYRTEEISKAIYELRTESDNHSRSLWRSTACCVMGCR